MFTSFSLRKFFLSSFFKYDNFFTANPNQGSAAREVKISRDKIKANINWLKLSYSSIEKFLIEFQPSIEKIDYRLPKNLVPYHYNSLVKPQFVNLVNNGYTYEGEVTISFRCIEDTNRLIFHINKLLIVNSTLKVTSLTDTPFTDIVGFSWTNDFERQFFVANLAQTFKANNNYTVFVQFTGYLTDDNAGFYRSSYLDNNQQRRWLLASQMEPTDARKSFPCFDEPALKAVFVMRVEHLPDYNAISNMPVLTSLSK